MELLYIWISKYRNLEKIGFNFSSKYHFNYNYNSGKLNFEHNKNYIPDFFLTTENKECKCKIQNITAIIGQNGVGKTTILDFIKYNFSLTEDDIDSNLIYAIKKNSIINVNYSSDLFINNKKEIEKLNDFKIKFNEFNDSKNQIVSDFENTSIIFFSNIFDNKKLNTPSDPQSKLIDISTNYLLYKDREDFKNPNYQKRNERQTELIKGVNPLIIHRQYDIKRQIYFKVNDIDKLCEIELPNQILIQIKELNIKSIFPNKPLEKTLIGFYDYLNDFEKFFNDNMIKFFKDDIIHMLFRITKSLYFNFVFNASLYNYFFKVQLLRPQLPNINSNDKIELKKSLKTIFNNLFNTVYQGDSNKAILETAAIRYSTLIENSLSFLEVFWGLINKKRIDKDQIFIEAVKKENSELDNLINCYIDTSPYLDYINFEWTNLNYKSSFNLSSGEVAKLNFYSRFFDVIKGSIDRFSVNKFSKLESNILILIDEGELFYHPQWQKNFLFDLISHLPKIFSKKIHSDIKLQIILTSNSPFIASDLPKENIVFLKRNVENENKIETTNLEDQKLTFSANIHTLFTDSFFVKDGLIGNFAKSKIDEAIKTLYDKEIDDLTKENIDEIRKVIEMIGEPVIKARMLQMLEDKIKSNLLDIDKRLRKVEEDINQINRRTKE